MKHKLPSDLDWRLLTPREYKIAWLLHHGLSYAAIGRELQRQWRPYLGDLATGHEPAGAQLGWPK